jgi:hypothetical protein
MGPMIRNLNFNCLNGTHDSNSISQRGPIAIPTIQFSQLQFADSNLVQFSRCGDLPRSTGPLGMLYGASVGGSAPIGRFGIQHYFTISH